MTMVMSGSVAGAEMMTFWAPASRCFDAPARSVKMPVASTTTSTPTVRHQVFARLYRSPPRSSPRRGGNPASTPEKLHTSPGAPARWGSPRSLRVLLEGVGGGMDDVGIHHDHRQHHDDAQHEGG